MNYKLLTYIRISLAIFYYKIFTKVFGRGYENINYLIEKKLDKIKLIQFLI